MPYSYVIELRSMILRSKKRENVKSHSNFVSLLQELALSEKPVDIEAQFKGKPVYRFSFSEILQPMGPSANLKSLRLCENVHILKKVESILENELSAKKASVTLYTKGLDVYRISTILSSGILGSKKQLVPTRWSITAVDDMIAKHIIEEVKQFPQLENFFVFESYYLGNHFVILFMPGSWQFENFETWSPGSFWAQQLNRTEIVAEWEPYTGRKKYAESQAGGYYASRLACVEYLARIKKQASVLAFREIDSSYSIPLGVWVVRETARHALKCRPKIFTSQKDALYYVSKKLTLPLKNYIKKSKILSQKSLKDFYTKL
jgi:hypothetical protein